MWLTHGMTRRDIWCAGGGTSEASGVGKAQEKVDGPVEHAALTKGRPSSVVWSSLEYEQVRGQRSVTWRSISPQLSSTMSEIGTWLKQHLDQGTRLKLRLRA